ncbi:ribonuclease E inhibitor RraB [Vibrio campbellii]|uniref:ribonuclease E inhibitor RraB n=1 Tax=Vibrio campbellii TaxID=680 RepID=UPI00026C470A|nr:ribonuclease E inhibitor RraB [Vibrio campbellii]AXB33238.1 ribonuclease E inhibitor RraB [Vibrio campbellii]
MSIVNKIIESAESDVDVLRRLDAEGDNFSLFREVDFHFKCPDPDKADVVAGFINDFQFGVAEHVVQDGLHYVDVKITMPVNQNIVSCVSGFMVCVAELYKVEFDGWGCVTTNY